MSEWQPIETAPRDGRWILLCGGKDDAGYGDSPDMPVVAAFWMTDWGQNIPGQEPNSIVGSGFDGMWAYCHWDGSWRSEYAGPTHWQPLPEPPNG